MTLPLALLLAAVAVMALVFLYIAGTAPEGWEDDEGFHLCGDVHAASDTISRVQHHGA